MANDLVPFNDLERMANAVAKSGLFGMKDPNHAMALMLVAQAEGLHPMAAVQQFHIINGQPSRKAWSMLERFQTAGGTVDWKERTDQRVRAVFTHPRGGSAEIDWDHARAAKAGINNPMWKKYPRQMLTARVISEGVRTVFPGATGGFYTPEEEQDMKDVTPPPAATARAAVAPADSTFGLPHVDEDGVIQEPEVTHTPEFEKAESWGNEAIRRIEECADVEKIDAWLKRNKEQLEKIRAVNPDAAMSVVSAADYHKRKLGTGVAA